MIDPALKDSVLLTPSMLGSDQGLNHGPDGRLEVSQVKGRFRAGGKGPAIEIDTVLSRSLTEDGSKRMGAWRVKWARY